MSRLPAGPLRPYILEYKWIGGRAILDEWIGETVMPVPVSGLCFQVHRQQPLLITHERMEKEVLPESYILPPNTKRFTAHYRGGVQVLAAIFRPAAFYEIFGWPLHAFTDRTVSLSDTEEQVAFSLLQERLLEQKNPEQQVKVLDDYFLRKLNNKKVGHPAIHRAMAEIHRRRGVVLHGYLLEKSGVGSRQLRRLFNDYLGMPPRDFLRICRFYHAYWAVLSGEYKNLTKLAFDTGYYDQAHFIHEFRKFTGLSPQQFLEQEFLIQDKVAWKMEGL